MTASAAAAGPGCDYRPDWRQDAACRDADPELFFPDGDVRSARARVMTAKRICRSCPVRAPCLSWALASGEEAGIWGGLTEDERRGRRRAGLGWLAGGVTGRAAARASRSSRGMNAAATSLPLPGKSWSGQALNAP